MQHGGTPLIYAAMKGHVSTAKILIEHGAAIDHENKVRRGEWWSARLCGRGGCVVDCVLGAWGKVVVMGQCG